MRHCQDGRQSRAATKERIDRVVRSLRMMTVERGATPAEAAAAAEKAAELSRRYGLGAGPSSRRRAPMPDLEVSDWPPRELMEIWFPWFRAPHSLREDLPVRRHAVQYCLSGICDFYECEHYWSNRTGELKLFGYFSEVEKARVMIGQITRMIDDEYAKFVRSSAARGSTIASAFKVAMAQQLNGRLHQMARAQSEARRASREERQAAFEKKISGNVKEYSWHKCDADKARAMMAGAQCGTAAELAA